MSKRKREISYKLLHGNSREELESKVIKLLEEYTSGHTHDLYWETKSAPFYTHIGVAQAMVKIQENNR